MVGLLESLHILAVSTAVAIGFSIVTAVFVFKVTEVDYD